MSSKNLHFDIRYDVVVYIFDLITHNKRGLAVLRKTHLALAISAAVMLAGCSKEPEQSQTANAEAVETATADKQSNDLSQNPFFKEWNTPFGSPPFGEIKTADFLPAFKKGMAEHKKEIDAIPTSYQ